MQKIVVISDSFKGTLSSRSIAALAETVIHEVYPDCQVVGLPVADGGEGTVSCFHEILGGTLVTETVHGPWGEPLRASYVQIGSTAVIETASAAGLPLVGTRKDPSHTTTFGVGQLMRHAAEHGARKIILGLGGSATNDGGCGAAAALGVKFYGDDGAEFCPVGATLRHIRRIDISAAAERLRGITVEAMCDIDNPLCGERGAAAVFAPQKGADASIVEQLEQGLRHLAELVEADLGVSMLNLPGAGAAGGFGGGATAFFGAALRPGIDVVLDAVSFEARIADADFIITGEGKLDGQSLGGKVPIGIARRAKRLNIPLIAIVGVVGEDIRAVYQEGITAVFPTNRTGRPFEEIASRSAEDYRQTLSDLMHMLHLFVP